MRTRRLRPGFGGVLAALALTLGAAGSEARGQSILYGRPTRSLGRGTYGQGMRFGEFGYRLNIGEAFGAPYGGLGGVNYGAGYGFGPGFPPGGSMLYSSGYTSPGTNAAFSGYYPPFAAYGAYRNPAVFPFPSPNYGTPRGYPLPSGGRPLRTPGYVFGR